MKKVFLFLSVITIFLGSSCVNAQDTATREKSDSGNRQLQTPDKKILILYLSRTKNTKAIAEIIQKNVGGDLAALELVKPYPENYKAIVDQVARENETGFLPPLKTKIDGIEKYDVVFIGFPTWGMSLPPPIKSFLRQYDLSGKTVIPFNSHAGYGAGSGFETIKELCSNCKVLEGFSTKGGIERDGVLFVMEGEKEKQVQAEVTKWLENIQFTKASAVVKKLSKTRRHRF